MIKSMIQEGKIFPLEVTIKLLQRAMENSGNDNFLVDGFPRNEENRAAFESIKRKSTNGCGGDGGERSVPVDEQQVEQLAAAEHKGGVAAGRAGRVHQEQHTGRQAAVDNDEELRWAAIERLPTYNRLRKGILQQAMGNEKIAHAEVNVSRLGAQDKKLLMESILKVVEDDNDKFLLRLRNRTDRF